MIAHAELGIAEVAAEIDVQIERLRQLSSTLHEFHGSNAQAAFAMALMR